jgi:hypothetical protein
MWTTNSIAARTLIWLAAITIPVQGMPSRSCGCARSKICCQKDGRSKGCCCSAEKVREGRCCCADKQATSTGSCCSASRHKAALRSCCCTARGGQDSTCNCGSNCQCGTNQQPRPATPPVENNTAEKMASDSIATVSVATVYQPQTTQRHNHTSTAADALAALDRCVSFCRFTL